MDEMSNLEVDFLIKAMVSIYEDLKKELGVHEQTKPEKVIDKLKPDSFNDEKIVESFDLYILLATIADYNSSVRVAIENRLFPTYKLIKETNAIKFM